MRASILVALSGTILGASAVEIAPLARHYAPQSIERGHCDSLNPCKYAPPGSYVPDPKTIFLPNVHNKMDNHWALCKGDSYCNDHSVYSKFSFTFKDNSVVFDFNIPGACYEDVAIKLQREVPPTPASRVYNTHSCHANGHGGLSCSIPYSAIGCEGYKQMCPLKDQGGFILYSQIKIVAKIYGEKVTLYNQAIEKETGSCWFSFSYCCTKCPDCHQLPHHPYGGPAHPPHGQHYPRNEPPPPPPHKWTPPPPPNHGPPPPPPHHGPPPPPPHHEPPPPPPPHHGPPPPPPHHGPPPPPPHHGPPPPPPPHHGHPPAPYHPKPEPCPGCPPHHAAECKLHRPCPHKCHGKCPHHPHYQRDEKRDIKEAVAAISGAKGGLPAGGAKSADNAKAVDVSPQSFKSGNGGRIGQNWGSHPNWPSDGHRQKHEIDVACESAQVVIYGQGEHSHKLKELGSFPGHEECKHRDGHYHTYVKHDLDVTVAGALELNNNAFGAFTVEFDKKNQDTEIVIRIDVWNALYYVVEAAVFIECKEGIEQGWGNRHGSHICRPETYPYWFVDEKGIGNYDFHIKDEFQCKGDYVFALWVKVCIASDRDDCHYQQYPISY
ncbi:hypothetical protein LIA77_03497 [Sarocladium implicatum]|nr:hypothetical protein LIA77_03497 [Sarocladium implicatum]